MLINFYMRRKYFSLNYIWIITFDICMRFSRSWSIDSSQKYRLTARSHRWSWRVKTMRFSEVVCCLHESGFPKISCLFIFHVWRWLDSSSKLLVALPFGIPGCHSFLRCLQDQWQLLSTPEARQQCNTPKAENDWVVKRYLWLGCWIIFPMDC